MDVTDGVTCTLRAEAHHPPCVMESAGFCTEHSAHSRSIGSVSYTHLDVYKRQDIYIINRENVQWLIDESGIPFDFDMVVIDELSSFKNHQTKRFKSCLLYTSRCV